MRVLHQASRKRAHAGFRHPKALPLLPGERTDELLQGPPCEPLATAITAGAAAAMTIKHGIVAHMSSVATRPRKACQIAPADGWPIKLRTSSKSSNQSELHGTTSHRSSSTVMAARPLRSGHHRGCRTGLAVRRSRCADTAGSRDSFESIGCTFGADVEALGVRSRTCRMDRLLRARLH